MSWSVSVPAGPASELGERINAAVAAWRETQTQGVPAETEEQIGATSKALGALLDSGAIGDGWVSASMGGHSNPAHDNTGTGSAMDMVNVGLYRQRIPEQQD